MMIVATAIAAVSVRHFQRDLKIDDADRWLIAVMGVAGATMTAKLPFVIFAGTPGFEFHSWLATWLGDGKTVLWGLAGGYLSVEFTKWWLGVRTRTGDSYVIPVAIAIAVGRIGCLINGCCYGRPTDLAWAMRVLSADGQVIYRHPAQLYEILFHVICASIAYAAIDHRWATDRRMLIYLISYCGFRFVSETIRTEPLWFAGLTFYQISSIVLAGLFMALLIKRQVVIRSEA